MTQRYMDFAPVKKKTAKKAGVSGGRVAVSQGGASVPKVRTEVVRPTPARPVARPVVAKPVTRPAVRPAMKSDMVKPVARPAEARPMARPAPRPVVKPVARPVGKPVARRVTTNPKPPVSSGRNTTVRGSRVATSTKVRLGEVEDLNPRFVKMDVPKRPLNDGSESNAPKNGAAEAKSKRIGGRLRLRSSKKANADNKTSKVQADTRKNQATYAVPKSPFINQDKVKKRPLSRNNYQVSDKEAMAVTSQMIDKKAGRKTTTIIDKPAKDSKMGMVVAIILTIILGAVAGTVAFLLLPK